jgi:hypothetical protein
MGGEMQERAIVAMTSVTEGSAIRSATIMQERESEDVTDVNVWHRAELEWELEENLLMPRKEWRCCGQTLELRGGQLVCGKCGRDA